MTQYERPQQGLRVVAVLAGVAFIAALAGLAGPVGEASGSPEPPRSIGPDDSGATSSPGAIITQIVAIAVVAAVLADPNVTFSGLTQVVLGFVTVGMAVAVLMQVFHVGPFSGGRRR